MRKAWGMCLLFGLGTIAAVAGETGGPIATSTEWAAKAPAREVIEKVRADERWLWQAKSVLIATEGAWTRTEAGIKHETAELQQQFPDMDFKDPKVRRNFEDLWPKFKEKMLWAWDEKRIAQFWDKDQISSIHEIDDGKQVLFHEQYFNNQQEHYALRSPETYLSNGLNMTGAFSIGRITYPDTWWERVNKHAAVTDCEAPLDQFKDLGIKERDGRRYRVLGVWTPQLRQKLWIDIATGHLTYLQSPTGPTLEDSIPSVENRFKDWREVKPGHSFPFEQGYSFWFYDGDLKGQQEFDRTIRITKLVVDEPLPEELFEMKFREGVQVHDWAHDPPLHYKYKEHFTKEEWDEIVAAAQRQQQRENASNEAQQALVGQPAPPMTAAKWLNGDPISLTDLKGKMVLIDFFAEWCGPCQNDYPILAALNKSRDQNRLVIIGVIAPETDEAKVQRLLKKFDLSYPIAVDQPTTPQSRFWGETFSAYKVDAIPHAVLVDPTGKIVMHGELGPILMKVNESTAKNTK